jgi:WhiB family transcriptional regulator, redox-sensing transcriptional regulator
MTIANFDLVDSEVARRHLQTLQVNGMTQKEIGKAAGISRETVAKILAGQQNVSRNTEAAILAIEPPAFPDPGWTRHAECRTERATELAAEVGLTVLDLFYVRFEESHERAMRRRRVDQLETLRTICEACPVATECLTHAVERPELYGAWGGKTQREITHIRNSRKQTHT